MIEKTPIGQEIAATIEALNQLHAPIQARKAAMFEQLKAAVAAYDAPPPTEQTDEGEPWRTDRPTERRSRPESESDPFVPLPRTRPGHEFGPRVRQRLIHEALREERW